MSEVLLESGSFFGEPVRRLRCGEVLLVETHHARGGGLPWHRHAEPYVTFVLRGSYVEEDATRRRTCRAGSVVVHPAGEPHADRFDRAAVRLVSLEVHRPRSGPLADAFERPALLDGPDSRRWSTTLSRELQRPDPWTGLVVESVLAELSVRVLRSDHDADRPPSWFVEAERIVERRFAEPLTLTTLADEVGVGSARLARAFRRWHGTSAGEHVRAVRASAVERRLHGTESLAAIAHDCGFADQSHMTRTFSRVFGTTPGRYRRGLDRHRA